MTTARPATILIGGKLRQSILPTLIEAAWTETVSFEYAGKPVTQAQIEAHIRKGKAPLKLEEAEADGGEFERLERFCVTHGLSFRRTCESDVGTPAQIAMFVPPMSAVVSACLDEGLEVMVPLRALQHAHKEGRSLAQALAPYACFDSKIPSIALASD